MQAYRDDSGRVVGQSTVAATDALHKYDGMYEQRLDPFETFRGRVRSLRYSILTYANTSEGGRAGAASFEPIRTSRLGIDTSDLGQSQGPGGFHLLYNWLACLDNLHTRYGRLKLLELDRRSARPRSARLFDILPSVAELMSFTSLPKGTETHCCRQTDGFLVIEIRLFG